MWESWSVTCLPHGDKDQGEIFHHPCPLPPGISKSASPWVMTVGELAPSLPCCSTWESGPCTLPRQHSGACPDGVGVDEPAKRAREHESWLCPLLVIRMAGSSKTRQKSSLWCGAEELTSSDTSQDQIQDLELAHPNIYPIEELQDP